MLIRDKVIAALERKREQFLSFRDEQRHQAGQVADKLDAFLAHDSAVILKKLALAGIEWPGALPTAEFDQADRLHIPFGQAWQSHDAARAWAQPVLQDAPVAAVDGSQIMPTKDIALPLGAVQIGWFVNYHAAGGRYEKDVSFDVLAPDELGDESDDLESGFPDWRVNQQRFVGECERVCALMERFAAERPARRPLCFFDGSLVISFAGQLRPNRAAPYLQAVQQMLDASQQLRVPLAGFVDSSMSRDLVTLLNHVVGPPHLSLTDGGLLGRLLPAWGDRSPIFRCARLDILTQQQRAPFYKEIAFCYMRLTADRPPARIELPLWMVEEGWAEEALDLVRAECVIGAGYPYAIETADATAVIQQAERERFLALVQQFAEREGLSFRQTRKSLSKVTRRG
jgi:hypothetical protein